MTHSFSSTCLENWTPAHPSKHRCQWGAQGGWAWVEAHTAGIFLPHPRPVTEGRRGPCPWWADLREGPESPGLLGIT